MQEIEKLTQPDSETREMLEEERDRLKKRVADIPVEERKAGGGLSQGAIPRLHDA